MGSEAAAVQVHVHAAGDRGLDGILRLIELAGSDSPLDDRLSQMCGDVATITGADVVSLYVRDGALLTMRGNIGFSPEAIGTTLRVGEGITGFVAECLRPVSAEVAQHDERYKPVPALGEERFPAFLAVPILRGGTAGAVLVLQRRHAQRFTDAEVALAAALAAPFTLALDHAERLDRQRRRAVRLRGTPVSGGGAMGRAVCLPTLSALAGETDHGADSGSQAVIRGLERLATDLERAQQRLGASENPEVARALSNLALILHDARFRERARAAADQRGLLAGLTEVARDYARVPYRIASRTADMRTLLDERAREVEDLCVLIHARARGEQFVHAGSTLLAPRVGAFVSLCATARGAAALVSEDVVAPGSPAAAIAAAAGVPLIAEVDALFSWARPSDLVIVDGDGTVFINPPASAVARLRETR